MKNQSQTIDTESKSVLEVDQLSVEYETGAGAVKALRDISFKLQSGETFGLAGESGSGKSTLGLAILNYLDDNGSVSSGDIRFHDESLLSLDASAIRSIRGKMIAHVPQDPKTSLNPSIQVGEQVAEVLRAHFNYNKKSVSERTTELFDDVGLPEPEHTKKQYPHELSGGMQQRVLVAIALACEPDLIIMDEPTSGLDVTTKSKILDLINQLQESFDTTILMISHDLGEIAETADRVGILYAGELMEVGPVETVFSKSMNPYTRGLLKAVPSRREDQRLESIEGSIPDLVDIDSGCIFADRCEYAEEACRTGTIEMADIGSESHQSRCRRTEDLDEFTRGDVVRAEPVTKAQNQETILHTNDLKKYYRDSSVLQRYFGETKPVRAVDDVSITIQEGEALGLVGESGCGKSTLAQAVSGLTDITNGGVKYRGIDIHSWEVEKENKFRKETGMVFQNPHSSLNPSKTVYQIISRPLETLTDFNRNNIDNRIIELLNQVGLSETYAKRFPEELSGGEKQRVAIARAFAANPSFVILDEPVSALDLSVQANIVNLLRDLQNEYNCSYLFISHDLSVVKNLCDRIAVMYLGKIVEIGTTSDIFAPPYHPYTRSLISNINSVDPESTVSKTRLEGTVPSARDPPSGCNFCTRCPKYKEGLCDTEEPELERSDGPSSDHSLSCHLDTDELSEELEF